MFGSVRERSLPKKHNFLISLPLFLLLIVSLMIPTGTFAETAPAKSKFSIEVKDKFINLHSENSSALEILRELEKKTGMKIDVFPGVIDKKVTLDVKNLPVFAIGTLFEQMSLNNFAVFYENGKLASFFLPEGKDLSEYTKGKTVIRPANSANVKNADHIKGREIVSTTRGKNNMPVMYVKDEILLKFHRGVSEEEIDKIIKKYNLVKTEGKSLSKIGYVKARIYDGRDIISVIKEIRSEHNLKIPEPNYISTALAVSDPLYGSQWYIPDIKFDAAWDKAKNTNQVKVAVIDSGVNSQHPDLQGKVLKGYDFVNGDEDTSDDHGHGTFVSGIISASSNSIGIKGLYDYARIIPVKAINENGLGTYEDVAGGIIYAADNGAKVINLSIGGYGYSFMLQDAVDYALEKGCIVVAAGGNDGIEQEIYPAAYPDVIGVSALGFNGQIWSGSNSGRHIDVAAPGSSIISTGLDDDYIYATGTSASTAMVSGLASMLVSERPDLSSSVIERLIMQAAKDLGEKGRDKIYGSGEVDAITSLRKGIKPFHDVAVGSVHVEPMVFEKGKPTYIVANIENAGTYKSEKFDVVLYEIVGEVRKEIGRQGGVDVIDKTKVIFEWAVEGTKENVKFEIMVISENDSDNSNNIKTTLSFSLKETDGFYVLYKNMPFVHSWVALQAYSILPSGGLKDELSNSILYGGATDDQLFGTERIWEDDYEVPSSWITDRKSGSSVFEGTWEEDKDIYSEDGLIETVASVCRHFWDPDIGYNAGFDTNEIIELFPCIANNKSSLYQAQYWWNQAILKYLSNKPLSYYYLGRVIHLLGDTGVTEHVHNDSHPSNAFVITDKDDYSNYEEYTGINYRDYTGSGSPKIISSLPLNLPSSYYVPADYDLDLARLFYNMGQYTQHYDSSNYNGNNLGYGGGTITMGILSDSGNKNQAYQAIAYLNEGSDRIDPGTSITIYWRDYNSLLNYTDKRIYEGPYLDSTYYVDISRGYGQIALSDGLWDAMNDTRDELRVTYTYRGTLKTDSISNFKDNPHYYGVPDHLVDDQVSSIFSENIRYVAALYQLFWERTHNLPSKVISPSPGNGITGLSINTDISWSNGGGATSYDVYFGTDSSPDCTEFKGIQTSLTYNPGTLAYSTEYYWKIDAKNPDGTTTGDVWHFKTADSPNITLPPTVTTVGLNLGSITQTSVELSSGINPNGSSTTAYFQYGLTTSYGSTTSSTNMGSGSSMQELYKLVSGLQCGTTYHVRAVAYNNNGTSYGPDGLFTTSGCSNPILTVTPSSQSVNANNVSTTFSVNNTGAGTMSWTASVISGESWLSITLGTSGTNEGTITVAFLANTLCSSRTGTIRVTAAGANGSPKDITVVQSGLTCAPISAAPYVFSAHFNSGYYAEIYVQNDGHDITSVTVSGPGISGAATLIWEEDRFWWRLPQNPFLGISIPQSPQTYTFAITLPDSSTVIKTATITGYVNSFATNLLPSGTVTSSSIQFSWTGFEGATSYGVELDGSNGRIWETGNLPPTTLSYIYDGPALTPGTTYYYYIRSQVETDGVGNISLAPGQFVYSGATTQPDTTPDQFIFTDQTNVALSTVITSNTITVSGINAAASISITGGTYSINGGSYTSSSGTVSNGNTVSVRQTSSGSYSTTTNATLTIGGVSDTFTVRTLTDPQKKMTGLPWLQLLLGD